MKVLVLGASGMLGSTIFSVLSSSGYEVTGSTRDISDKNRLQFHCGRDSLETLLDQVGSIDYLINCIGQIPQKESDTLNYNCNWELPFEISKLQDERSFKTIQIATDCIFDGAIGNYTESSPPSAIDEYGLSKIKGEMFSTKFMNLRTSIIGYDRGNYSLQSWLLSQKNGANLQGYRNHIWNGITTLAFSRIVYGIVGNNLFEATTYHIKPLDQINKFHLLKLIAVAHDRNDLRITPHDTNPGINRALETNYPKTLENFWRSAGYDYIPSIEELVNESATRMRTTKKYS